MISDWSGWFMSIQLKDLVNDQEFIDRMNQAFADLRADYELSLDTSKKKITELQQVHVDYKSNLSDLISYSIKSSGVVTGLRGTGKTHLFLLAREAINQDIQKNGAIALYLNVKRLHIPQGYDQEIFNRVFSIFLYDEFSKQLIGLLEELSSGTILDKILQLFNNDKRDLIKAIGEAIARLAVFSSVVHEGSQKITNLDKGTQSEEETTKALIKLHNDLVAKIGLKTTEVTNNISVEYLDELTSKVSTNNTYVSYLNIQDVRNQLINVLKILKLSSITFYVDEWEKLYYDPKLQQYLAFYIDRIIDTPFYFWIGVVPQRGKLYNLENGSDLQHYINLDEGLVYENSKQEKSNCIVYFKNFVNKRLLYYFNDSEYELSILFNNDKNFELLVLASMGNSRDFGTMLLHCWSEYKSYRTNNLMPGRPYQYISHPMIIDAIKNNGDKKFSNIKDDAILLKIWKDVENYCISKKSSHFAIEETKENLEILSSKGFSELSYHRLLHFRKGHVPAKDADMLNKLSIYALNYAGIYDLHAKNRKLKFVVEYDTIHDKVRRYIYNPKAIIESIKIKAGEIFPCKSCDENIYPEKMISAWEKNSCPFCGGNIYNK